MKWKFSHIEHAVRLAMGLNLSEYAIFDIFYKSQTHPDYNTKGWASNSYGDIASGLGVSKGTVHSTVERGVLWGLMEVDETDPRLKRTTAYWYNFAYLDDVEGLHIINYRNRSENERSENERPIVQKMNEIVQKMNAKELKTETINLNERKGTSKNDLNSEDLDPFQITLLFAADQIASEKALAGLPPDEVMIRKTIEKAYLYLFNYPAMKKTICDPAGSKMSDLEFVENIFQWIRRNSNDRTFVQNVTRRITGGPSNLFAWINNGKYLKLKNNESGINAKNRSIFTKEKALEVYADIASNGFR